MAYDLDTREVYEFLEGDLGWMQLLSEATLLVGHNIVGYDIPMLKKLFGFVIPKHVQIVDTLVMSQVTNYRRFGMEGHGLGTWGKALGYEKIDFHDFSRYTEEMRIYCIRDVKLNVKVFEELVGEFNDLIKTIEDNGGNPEKLKHYMRAEQAALKWCAEARVQGWPFDVEGALALMDTLEKKLTQAYTALNQRLGTKCVPVDKHKGVVESKKPKWIAAGFYDRHTANWFGVAPESGYPGEERMIEGEYSRITFEPLSLDSVTDVKVFLFRNGWVPTEYNMKDGEPDERGRIKKIQGSPKITEDSLEFLGGDGKLYSEFLTAKARFSIVKTWLEHIDDNGNVHGDCITIGTPSMRARHSIIVNVPSTDAPYGKEMRSLFICKPGWKLIGCDSSGNQARGLAHYLKDPGFIDTLLNGDIHQYNADILTGIVRTIPGVASDFVVKRSQAKRILYAFLFGASGAKLWSYIFGTLNQPKGNQLKKGFIKAVPGFEALITKLDNVFGATKRDGMGYIPSLAGNPVYVDSFHKLLVYLLQAAEKITCATALMLTVERLEQEGIPYIPGIFYHDEIDFMVPEQYAERAAQIGKEGFRDGPKLYGIEIMDGDAKIGNSWYDIH